jgi:hypothetical protein
MIGTEQRIFTDPHFRFPLENCLFPHKLYITAYSSIRLRRVSAGFVGCESPGSPEFPSMIKTEFVFTAFIFASGFLFFRRARELKSGNLTRAQREIQEKELRIRKRTFRDDYL